jgi:hypothetical protein
MMPMMHHSIDPEAFYSEVGTAVDDEETLHPPPVDNIITHQQRGGKQPHSRFRTPTSSVVEHNLSTRRFPDDLSFLNFDSQSLLNGDGDDLLTRIVKYIRLKYVCLTSDCLTPASRPVRHLTHIPPSHTTPLPPPSCFHHIIITALTLSRSRIPICHLLYKLKREATAL